jgi:short-subunit dehydrogenase
MTHIDTSSTGSTPTALITGATSGIGLEMARQLAAKQADLVLVARRAAELEKLARQLQVAHGVSVTTIVADLSVAGAAAGVFEEIRRRQITVDWLINNAGVGLYGDHADLDPADIAGMLQLNVIAVSDLCRLFGAEMKQRGSGRILNIASTAAYQPAPYFAAYGASKAFVLNFSEALAKELEDYGVTVSCLSPGPTQTAFFNGVDSKGITVGYFEGRDDAAAVAGMGIDLMLRGGLSQIVGTRNYLRAFSARIAPRSVVAGFSKRFLGATHAH